MKQEYSKQLNRQIQKFLKNQKFTPELSDFMKAVDESYKYFDRDRLLLERTLELTSSELTTANEQIRKENQLALEKLSENEQTLNSINKNLREAIFRVSIDGNLAYANHAFQNLFRLEGDYIHTPKSIIELFNDKSDWEALIYQLDKSGALNNVEVQMKKENGELFWGLISLVKWKSHSQNLFFDGSIINITERKEFEQDLRQANELLTKTNEELDRFVYSASHDLRAPLLSLLGLVNVMELEQVEGVSIYLDQMKGSISKMDAFIKEIIEYSYNSRQGLKVSEIDLVAMANESYNNYKYLPGASEMIFEVSYLTKKVPFYSDIKRLQIVFNNLVGNAINYKREQLKPSFIKIEISTDLIGATIKITDNGIGIDQPHLIKIFDMFYRASDNSSGSGLGLYIVRETINKLSGKVLVESELEKGTIFNIQLPNLAVGQTEIIE